jgi:hypothetical protein
LDFLETEKKFSPIFKQILTEAKGDLRKAHGQEIDDGYNMIPKAAEMLKGPFSAGGQQFSAVDIGAFYRDKILTCEDCYTAFAAIIFIAEYGKSGAMATV